MNLDRALLLREIHGGHAMKKIVFISLIILLAVGIVLGGCSEQAPAPQPSPTPQSTPASSPAQAKTFEIKYSGVFPQGQIMEKIPEWWINEVESRTQGRLKVTPYFGQALGAEADFGKMLRGGVHDMCLLAGSSAETPVLNLFSAPYVVTNTYRASLTFWALYHQGLLEKDLGAYKVLWCEPVGVNYPIMANKKVTTMEEMKGMKIRGRAGFQIDFYEALGATGVALPSAEVYMALDRGIVDGLNTASDYAKSVKLNEVTKYWIWEPIFLGGFAVTMSKDTWNSLPPDIQVTVDELSQEANSRFLSIQSSPSEDRADIEAMGWEVYELSPAEKARWRAIGDQIVEKWAQEQDAKGNPAKEALKVCRRVDDLLTE
jgi:TRAP-type C4-dicarboxylate transport system substrate-binding protein